MVCVDFLNSQTVLKNVMSQMDFKRFSALKFMFPLLA